MLKGVLISLALAAVVFFLCFFVGTKVLDRTVYGKPFIRQMENLKFEDLQEHVTKDGIASSDVTQLSAWCRSNRNYYLAIYRQGLIFFESDEGYEDASVEVNIDWEDPERQHDLTFADGTVTQAFLYYAAGDAYYYLVIAISAVTAVAVFALSLILLVRRKVSYIRQMHDELNILAGGDMTYPMTVKGNDELSDLAAGIDEMRRSIQSHQEAEGQMRSANSELVTAMSHDLRTPLTALTGYLELLSQDKCESEEQRRDFLQRCLEKTGRIRDMADKLFEYVLVYSTEWEQPDLEPVSSDVLIWTLQEYADMLRTRGFQTETDLDLPSGELHWNAALMRRVFDNLYSNLIKYADPSVPVLFSCKRDRGSVRVSLENASVSAQARKEGTNIGLKTCERILALHGGRFEAGMQDGRFTAAFVLPVRTSA